MTNISRVKKDELSVSRPSPFVSSAKLVAGIGIIILGGILKGVKGATGLLFRGPLRKSQSGATNLPDKLQRPATQDISAL